jgi:hypothetical protein
MIEQPGPDWHPNTGRQPERAKGRRIAVVLANGSAPPETPVTPVSPPGWAADSTRWSLTGSAFDIAWYRIIGGGPA